MALLLVAHGAVHILGFLWAFHLADIEEIGGATMLISNRVPGDPMVVGFGLLWLLSTVALMVAGIGVAGATRWSLPLAGVAAGVSLIPTVVWWADAWIGAVISGLILVIVAAVFRSSGLPRRPSAISSERARA